MQRYYEILDEKYWTSKQKLGFKPQVSSDVGHTLKIISLIFLAFVFWSMNGPSKYSWILDLLGLGFALWAFVEAKRSVLYSEHENYPPTDKSIRFKAGSWRGADRNP